MLEEFKSIVTEVLTPHASAILLDPGIRIARGQAPLQKAACCWRMKKPGMTRPVRGACLTCWTTGLFAA